MQGTAVICQRFSILHEHQVVPAGFGSPVSFLYKKARNVGYGLFALSH